MGFIAMYMRLGLVARGSEFAAAILGRFGAAAMVAAAAAVFVAITTAIMRILVALVVDRAHQRRNEAQDSTNELQRYKEREEKLRALADAVQRERKETDLPLAS
jgi:membrane protein implicated in regulation of membrane protease activity